MARVTVKDTTIKVVSAGKQGPPGTGGNWLSVKTKGAKGDGTSDDSGAFTEAQTSLNNDNGGVVTVPFESTGYKVGDGSTSGTGIELTDKSHWKGDAEVKLIHQAKNDSGNNFLFTLEDIEDAKVEGFEIDGGSGTRIAVTLKGTVDNVVLRDLHIRDCDNFALQYADTDTNTASAYFNNVLLENVRIDGVTGAVGGGSGLEFFPRAGDAFSQGLTLSYVDSDVSEGSTTRTDHGPQACKISNTQNVQLSHCRFRGGQVGALVLTTGVRDVQIESLHTSLASRGISIDGSVSAAATSATPARRINISSFTYRTDGITGGDDIGINLEGDLHSIHFGQFDMDGDLRLRANANTDDLHSCTFGSGVIHGADFTVDPDGNTPTADITNFHFGSLSLLTPAANTAVKFGDTDWNISESSIDRLYVESFPLQAIEVKGDDNRFGEIHAHDGNTGGSSVGTAVRDSGNDNVYDLISLTGASHDTKFFLRKLAGDGLTVRGVKGTPVNAQGFDFQNLENADVPQGDVIVRTQAHDLSGANDTIELYVADVDTYILGVKFFYTQASSADAGVDQELRIDKSTILTYTSETSQSQFSSTNYINTSGTRSFATRKIAKGQYLDILMRGGKTGSGEIIAQVSLVRARS